MPTRAIVQVSLNRDGGLPEDVTVNQYHFEGDSQITTGDRAQWDTDIDGCLDRVETFYQSIGTYLASTLSGTGTIKAYDFDDPTPRIPRVTRPFTFTPSGSRLPAEVALCLSMVATPAAGANPRRRRGRVFLGPLSDGVPDVSAPDARPGETARQAILTAAETMAVGSSNTTMRLAIYSPTQGAISGQMDAAWNDVTLMYIDDAFDTVRGRGARPTSRVSVTVS